MLPNAALEMRYRACDAGRCLARSIGSLHLSSKFSLIMKQTFIILSLLAAVGTASAATLQYGLDFNTKTSADDLDISSETTLGSGTTTVTEVNGSWSNYYTDTPLNDGGYAHAAHGGTFSIGSADASTGIDGLSFADGFSIGLHLNRTTTSNWVDALTLTIDSVSLRLEMHLDGEWRTYGDTSGTILPDNTSIMAAGVNEWKHLGLTFKGSTMQVFVDGSLTHTYTLGTTDSSVIKSITGGGSNKKSADVRLDNLAVYDGVLTSENFTYLATHAMPMSFESPSPAVPEPATATLSLLALAGLAARRRRK